MENNTADIQSEGQALEIDKSFDRLVEKNKGDTTSSESQPEKKETVKSPTQEGEHKDNTSDEKIPFHKHPRWIKTQETLKSYEAKLAEYDKKMKEFESSKQTELPEWWKKQYGDDANSQKSYQNYEVATKAERDRIKQEVQAGIREEMEKEQSDTQGGEEYVETQIAEMTDEGLKFDRNVLLKFMVDFQKEYGSGSLLDEDGNYDFRKSLALMNKMQPEQSDSSVETKKRIAADTMRSKGKTLSGKDVPVISRRALRGGWRDLGI